MTATLIESNLKVDDKVHGFTVVKVTPVEDMHITAIELRHDKSGATAIHLLADDPENLFAATFRTPPEDDTGLPHILEHTVLCGSKKYPVKDPFVELNKTSLATFLNAMTYPDRTVYPCCSMTEKDFFNIMDVYCDAVFNPNITEEHFKQEGHHFDFAEPGNTESDLIIKGIVYNEMKGVFSNPDSIVGYKSFSSIFPDNAYGFESGGAPKAIPNLTYKQFRNFYKKYYHPSNSALILYGNIATEKLLAYLDNNFLSAYDRISLDSSIEIQKKWDSPKTETISLPAGPDEDPEQKSIVTINYLCNEIKDAVTTLAMELLDTYLIDNDASPLRKALIDSKLGEDLTNSGYANYIRQAFYTIGMKGTSPVNAEKIASLVKETCTKIAKEGLNKDKVESALHALEISSREIGSNYPLKLMEMINNAWCFDLKLTHHLHINRQLTELRELIENKPRFLENILQEMIVDNPHYTLLTFIPDKNYVAQQEAEFTAEMAEKKKSMSQDDLNCIVKEAAKLDRLQSEPNTPENLATLPRLGIDDVSPDPIDFYVDKRKCNGQTMLVSDVFTNGLNYMQVCFDLRGLEEELYDYIPLFGKAMCNMGAAGSDYIAMAEREAACCGGIGCGFNASGTLNDPLRFGPTMTVSGKALDRKFPEFLTLLEDRILKAEFDDKNRLKDLLLQARIGLRSAIVPSGHTFAIGRAACSFSANRKINERFTGISQLKLVEKMVADFDAEYDNLVTTFKSIQQSVLNANRVTVSFAGNSDSDVSEWMGSLCGKMSQDNMNTTEPKFTTTENEAIGLAAPCEVAYNAMVMPTISINHPDSAALQIMAGQFRFDYLWNEIRAKRGAYGAFSIYNSNDGLFALGSYRDPCVAETYRTYEGLLDFIKNEMDLSPETWEQSIIGSIKSMDRPIRPGEAVVSALHRHLSGINLKFRKEYRNRVLSSTPETAQRIAKKVLTPAFKKASRCTLSSRAKIEAAKDAFGGKEPDIIDV